MQGEDDRYHGPNEIRTDPKIPGFTPDKQVIREESPPDANGRPGGFQYISFADPLTLYEGRRIITLKERRAGEKLYRLWYYGCNRSPYVTMRYGEVPGGSDADAVMLLSTEYYAAIQSIRGEMQRKIAYDVCCVGNKAGRGGILPLREALQDLMDHFKKTARKQNEHQTYHNTEGPDSRHDHAE